MATTSSTPTKPPLLNERERRGTKIRSLNADVFTVAQVKPAAIGAAYLVNIDIIGVRLLTAAATLPCAYALSRRALFMTDANGVISQQGSADTIGTDLKTDTNITLVIAIDNVNGVINFNLSAEYPTDWSVWGQVEMVDQFQVG